MSRENYDVFISYRRSDAVNEARSINDRLRLRQIRCFYDFDELKDRKFDEKILDAIKDAEIFITILSPDYFCRCSEKDDWVRKEIECAIANHKKIVPINVNNHFDGTKHIPENVPYNLSSGIIGHQFSEVYTGTTFNDNIDAIIRDRIQSEIPNIGTTPSNSVKIEISSDADCKVLKGGKEISQVQANSYNFIYLGPGNHRLVFQSVKYEDIEHKEIYRVMDEKLPYEDFIEVELLPLIEKQEDEIRKEQEEQRKQEEADRKAREERARLAEEKRKQEEADRKAREEQARLAEEQRKQEEADRKAREERARLAEEQRKQEEAARKAREEQARLAEEERKRNEITQRSGTLSGHDYVDLGLSVKWATCNVGANKPEEYGNYYAWGETETKTEYTENNCKTIEIKKKLFGVFGDDKIIDKKENFKDTARANWGGTWRLPTKAEMEELKNKCTWTWITQNGVKGYKVTGPNGNSIFLPAAGYCFGSWHNVGKYGYYRSSTPYEGNDYCAYSLGFYSGCRNVEYFRRSLGRTVRPVSE
ncbi:MAG: TIR domain-containing protein [Bacteroidales bacterium]|nr:TIR domain-containing protein [Bacteroidales bacterium]